MPSRLIHGENGVSARRHGFADLGAVEVDGGRVAGRRNERRPLALMRTDGAEDVSRAGALIVRRRGARSALCPPPGDRVLLTDPSFLLEPDLSPNARALLGRDLLQESGEVFSNVSASLAFGA
jgi:hypothetical protein